jgi:molybdate transport system substrate-binding protein
VKKTKMISMLAAATLVCAMTGCGSSSSVQQKTTPQVELNILAAASLSDAMKELQATYEQQHHDVKLVQVFGSSGMLQQQIEQGAPADVFVSAGDAQMKALLSKQLIDPKQESNLLHNDLVLVVPKDGATLHALDDLMRPDVKKISIGQPDTVPAGSYAKQSLTFSGIWSQVQKKVVYAKDVRQVLSYVETGSVDAGLVYKTDALTSKRVTVVATADEKSHAPIVYPYGIVNNSPHEQQAQEFYKWLRSPAAMAVFQKYGFAPATDGNSSTP